MWYDLFFCSIRYPLIIRGCRNKKTYLDEGLLGGGYFSDKVTSHGQLLLWWDMYLEVCWTASCSSIMSPSKARIPTWLGIENHSSRRMDLEGSSAIWCHHQCSHFENSVQDIECETSGTKAGIGCWWEAQTGRLRERVNQLFVAGMHQCIFQWLLWKNDGETRASGLISPIHG